MAINSQQKVRLVTKKNNGRHADGLKTKYVVFKKGKTVCLAEKGLASKTFNDEAVREIITGDTVSILRNGMSRVQIARISRALNNSGAKITIVNK